MVHKRKKAFTVGKVMEWIEKKSGEKYSTLSYDEKVAWINLYFKKHDVEAYAE